MTSLVRDLSAEEDRALADKLEAGCEGIVEAAAGDPVAAALPRADALPAASPYGPPAPAPARRHPRLILAWACVRALRWTLRDLWRNLISS